MSFEDLMGAVQRWGTGTDALAAVGAQLALAQPGADSPPEIADALRAVSEAAGIGDITELPPPQQAMALGIIRLYLHHAVDLVDHADRAAGWAYTDPEILDGMGRGSAMIPGLIAAAHPDLAEVEAFLDVGTGVGFLAIAATGVWPDSTVVGIDPWEPALERARANVAQADLGDRITLRSQVLADVDDVEAFDCAWIPTFFLTEETLQAGLGGVVKALRPGGWVVLGRNRHAPDPLTEATAALRWIRGGGGSLGAERAAELLEQAGCVDVHAPAPAGPAPIELLLGQRPAA
jgi:SAM-dependent methyltransferase